MKNTPEVTTALAKIVEDITTENFKELPYGLKRRLFHFIETAFPEIWGLKEEQYKEFTERFNETIRLPWFHSEV
jgi:hypothetical protein